jgi:hypothetical protein
VNSNNSKKSTAASESEAQAEPESEPESRADSKTRAYTILEILCVFFWFLLDGFWLLEWKYLTYAFSVIAVATAFLMFRFIKKERVIVLVACADTSWLILNILWAIGDLSKIQQALFAAKILFLVGGIFCLIAFCASEASKRLHILVLSRLRILKFFERTRLV